MKHKAKLSQYAISFLVVCIVAAICYPFSDLIGYRSVALIMLLTVSILAMQQSLYPALVATASSALIWNFFFIPPHFTFSVSDTEDSLLLAMYFIVALSSVVFNLRLRHFEQVSKQKEEREMAIKLYNTIFSSLSHELRTPIATILGATSAIEEKGNKLTQEDQSILFAEINNAAHRLNTQVENLLNTSRLESGIIRPNLEWCDVNELIYNSINKLESKLTKHQVIVNVPEEMPLVKLDFGLMEQVINNLLTNAIAYTSANSKITITASTIVNTTQINSTHPNQLDQLTIEFSDTGDGIPEDQLEHIFEKFYRLKNSSPGGTGLGLYIVKRFVEAQGGTITANNNDVGGTSFIMHINTHLLPKSIHHEFI